MKGRLSLRLSRLDRLDVVLVLTIAILGSGTLLLLATTLIHGHVVAPAFDLAVDTIGLIVCGTVAVLSGVRYRERRQAVALYQSAGFLVLAIAYFRAVGLTVGRDATAESLATPEQVQLYVFAVARIVAAILLVLGGTASDRGHRPRRAWLYIVVPTVVVLGIVGIVGSWPDLLPPIAEFPPSDDHELPVVTPFGVVVQLIVATMFFEAASSCRSLWRRERSIGDAYVAIGLVFAAFAELMWGLYPSGHPGQVASGDIVRLAFFIILLLGIEAEARAILTALRRANEKLERLRSAEVERAALEERTRLARELHDGLAQNLWLAKLKVGRLAGLSGLSAEARTLAGETSGAIELGLTEARQAVMALRIAADAEDSLTDLLGRTVDDFEDRFGLRVDFECPDQLPDVPVRTQAEILRIVQEALSNVRRHAAARVVRVRVELSGAVLSVLVTDDGRGFEPTEIGDDSYGLHAMRERAALIGAELGVESRPGTGTTVRLIVSVTAGAAMP